MREKAVNMIFILALLISVSFADDSQVTIKDNRIIPLQNNEIMLVKENISFELSRYNDESTVWIEFEFLNPDSDKELDIGFISPPDPIFNKNTKKNDDSNLPQIINFETYVNDSPVDYQVTTFNKTDLKSIQNQIQESDLVFYFHAKLKNGKNIIKHKYVYRHLENIKRKVFEYRLKTGSLWKNSNIKDFELKIIPIDFEYFQVTTKLQSKSIMDYWFINGKGKKNNILSNLTNVCIKDGFLAYQQKNFRPDNDLIIKLIFPFGIGNDDYNIDYDIFILNDNNLKTLTFEELKIIRNNFYALAGYKFKTPVLFDYFSKFVWYWPVPNLSSQEVYNEFPDSVKNFLSKIRELEELK